MFLPGKRNNVFVSRLLLAFAVVFFFSAAFYRLGDIFLFELRDEIFKYIIALKTLHILQGRETIEILRSLFVDPHMPFVMYVSHVGAPWLYAAVPLMAVFGSFTGLFCAFQLVMVLAGIVTLLSVYFVVSAFFSRLAGALAVFFLATNYVYIHAVRIGFYREEVLQIAGLWAGLALCLLSARFKRQWLLYAGFVVFGITLWAKVMFIGYIFSFGLGLFVAGREKRQEIFRTLFPSVSVRVFSCAAFFVGAAPMIYFHACSGFSFFRHLFGRVVGGVASESSGPGAWDNSNVLGNIACRLGHVREYFSGQLFEAGFFNAVTLLCFLCAFVWGLWAAGFSRDRSFRKKLQILFAFYFVALLVTCFLPYHVSRGHILLLVPFFEILLALFLVFCLFRAETMGRIVLIIVSCLWLGSNIQNSGRFYDKYFVKGEFWGLYPDELKRLVDMLYEHKVKNIAVPQPLVSLIRSYGHEGVELMTGMNFNECPTIASMLLKKGYANEFWMLAPVPEIKQYRQSEPLRVNGFNCSRVAVVCFRGREDCSFELYRVSRA